MVPPEWLVSHKSDLSRQVGLSREVGLSSGWPLIMRSPLIRVAFQKDLYNVYIFIYIYLVLFLHTCATAIYLFRPLPITLPNALDMCILHSVNNITIVHSLGGTFSSMISLGLWSICRGLIHMYIYSHRPATELYTLICVSLCRTPCWSCWGHHHVLLICLS